MTEAEYLAAEWTGPPAPMTVEQGSWLLAALALVVVLMKLASED
jgi:hypothetical protein